MAGAEVHVHAAVVAETHERGGLPGCRQVRCGIGVAVESLTIAASCRKPTRIQIEGISLRSRRGLVLGALSKVERPHQVVAVHFNLIGLKIWRELRTVRA